MEIGINITETQHITQAIHNIISDQNTDNEAYILNELKEQSLNTLFQKLVECECSYPFFTLIHSEDDEVAKFSCLKVFELLNPFHILINSAYERIQRMNTLTSMEKMIIDTVYKQIEQLRLEEIRTKAGVFEY